MSNWNDLHFAIGCIQIADVALHDRYHNKKGAFPLLKLEWEALHLHFEKLCEIFDKYSLKQRYFVDLNAYLDNDEFVLYIEGASRDGVTFMVADGLAPSVTGPIQQGKMKSARFVHTDHVDFEMYVPEVLTFFCHPETLVKVYNKIK